MESAPKRICIIKLGTSFPDTVASLGDFDAWTANAMGLSPDEVFSIDVRSEARFPHLEDCAGIVLTGSHSMVTERLPWSEAVKDWLPSVMQAGIPLLGICYGHQLLATAAGGQVDSLPGGIEIGAAAICLQPAALADPLFSSLPLSFPAYTAHMQAVTKLPAGAVVLASGLRDPHHAFRLGELSWGIQFHPEFDESIMRSYIDHHDRDIITAGQDTSTLHTGVQPCPAAASVLRRFAGICASRPSVTLQAEGCLS
ncbi:MAG: glutamine amidotransferase [Spirochaeta sp.]